MIKGELAGLWYAEVDPLSHSLFLMLLLFGILLLAQCGSVKAQHGVLLKTHYLSRRKSLFTVPVAVLQRSLRTNPVVTLLRLPYYFGLFRQ